MKWFQGYALAQTIYTCKYVHELDKLEVEDAFMRRAADSTYPVPLMTVVLRAFIRGTLKTCDMVMEELYKRHVYDVSASLYQITLALITLLLLDRMKTSLVIKVEYPC